MEAGLHLPLIDFGGAGLSSGRLAMAVDAARESGFAAISANDHERRQIELIADEVMPRVIC